MVTRHVTRATLKTMKYSFNRIAVCLCLTVFWLFIMHISGTFNDLTLCSDSTIRLDGRLPVPKSNSFYEDSDIYSGEWKPSGCQARQVVAVIIPYRNRSTHLDILLTQLHPMLQRQQLHYRIFVVEQYDFSVPFNKGLLMNHAFTEVMRRMAVDCLIFHDVDMIPEDDRNFYNCSGSPRHLAIAINVFKYRPIYGAVAGGVLNMRPEHFKKINGYTNSIWTWCCEDDDMYYRIKHNNLDIERPPKKIGRYTMLSHKTRRPKYADNPYYVEGNRIANSQRDKDRSQTDGLAQLVSKTMFVTEKKLYTKIMVDVGKPPEIMGLLQWVKNIQDEFRVTPINLKKRWFVSWKALNSRKLVKDRMRPIGVLYSNLSSTEEHPAEK